MIQHQAAVLMFILSIAGVYVMTAAAGYAERVLVTPIAFILIAIGHLYKPINKEGNRKVIICFVCFALFMMCLQAAPALFKMRGTDSLLHIRTELINTNPK